MRIKIIVICHMIAMISFLACTKEGNTPVSGTSPQQGEQVTSTARGSGQKQSSGNLAIRILPESPTVMKDLEAQADLPGGTGTATYQWKRNGQLIVGEHTERLAKNQFSTGDTISVIVTSDNSEGTASVIISRSSPKVVSVPFSPENIYSGVDLTVKPVGSNPNGTEVKFHYKWSINGKELPGDTPVLKGDSFKRGDIVALTIIPYDLEGEGDPFNSKKIVIPDAPPRIVSNPPQNFQGNVYTYKVVAEDPDGDPVTFSLASAPPGMVIDNKTGVITWQISNTPAGAYEVEIAVLDPEARKGTQKFTIPIDMPEGEKK